MILHLGDLAYRGNSEKNRITLRNLPGEKFFIWGNHDKQNENWYRRAGFIQVGKLLGKFEEKDLTRDGVPYTNRVVNWGFYKHFDTKRVLFSHYPDAWLLDWDINIHGHIHNNPYSEFVDASKDYRNVSVENMDYRPVRLSAILER
jgi:calcineurin-like phosphoesterase family protein